MKLELLELENQFVNCFFVKTNETNLFPGFHCLYPLEKLVLTFKNALYIFLPDLPLCEVDSLSLQFFLEVS